MEVTEGFSEVLDDAQLDEVYCSALFLSASVTEYLAKAIAYLEGSRRIYKSFDSTDHSQEFYGGQRIRRCKGGNR